MRIYFMGVGGTAMGNAACLLKTQGHEVFGSDVAVYPPMSEVLAGAGIAVLEGFDADRLEKLSPDLIVVGNALSRGNCEVEWLLDQSKLAYTSLPQLLGERILAQRKSIVVCGTHGKTTTSTILAYLLKESGRAPGWLIGGVPRDLESGAHLGSGEAFVIEGDEYDSAFFDKRSKFIHYRPRIALINRIEMDHADIFRDLEDVKRTFRHLSRIIPGRGHLIVNGDDANIRDILPVPWTGLCRVGEGTENDLRIVDFQDGPSGSTFKLLWKEGFWAEVSWHLHGRFNAQNAAMAAAAAALERGLADWTELDLSSLAQFQGVKRRQDLLFESESLVVMEDFGHHPTAIAGTLEALRAAYPGRSLTACFEPRSNTAARSIFEAEFEEALRSADRVFFAPVHRGDRIAAELRLDTHGMAARLGPAGEAFDTNQGLLERLLQIAGTERLGLVVFFSNGSFDGVPRRFVSELSRSG